MSDARYNGEKAVVRTDGTNVATVFLLLGTKPYQFQQPDEIVRLHFLAGKSRNFAQARRQFDVSAGCDDRTKIRNDEWQQGRHGEDANGDRHHPFTAKRAGINRDSSGTIRNV
jgi:hypothetical protein